MQGVIPSTADAAAGISPKVGPRICYFCFPVKLSHILPDVHRSVRRGSVSVLDMSILNHLRNTSKIVNCFIIRPTYDR